MVRRTRDLQRISTPGSKKSWGVGQEGGGRCLQTNWIVERSRNEEFDRSEAKTRARGGEGERVRTNTRAAYFKSHTIVRRRAKIQVNRRWDRDQAGRSTYQLAEENEETSFAITSWCSGCSEARPAPTVVPLAVVSSGEGLDHPVVGCIHNRRDPSSVVQCKDQVEVDRGKVGEYTCSAAFGESDGGGCGIVAASPCSSGVARQTFVQGCSSEEVQVRGWVRWVSAGTGVGQHGCSRRDCYWKEGSIAEPLQNRVCGVCWPCPTHHVQHPRLSGHQSQ